MFLEVADEAEVLDDDELASAVVELHRVRARLAAVSARLVGAADARRVWVDGGYRSTASWLADRCRLPGREARAEVRLARRLRTMPETTAAFERGDVGVAQAQRLASLNAGRSAVAFGDAEEILVGHACSLRWVEFERVCAYWGQVVDPDGAEDRAGTDVVRRRVDLFEGLDGTGNLDGVLTPVGRATVGEALKRIENELFEADWREVRGRLGEAATVADIERTPAQRRHDALVEMATRSMTAPRHGKRPRPLVTIFAGYETFAGRICELADGTVVSPGTVAGLLDQAVVERIVFDGPSRVIDVGRQRLFTGALRRAIEARDRFCTGPGCDVPAADCDVHHDKAYCQGGLTDQTNGDPNCGFHHDWRHRQDAEAKAKAPPTTRPAPHLTPMPTSGGSAPVGSNAVAIGSEGVERPVDPHIEAGVGVLPQVAECLQLVEPQ
jgi:uncharacterized protein DUF222